MNDQMKDAETETYEARAARARQRLSENLRDMTNVGESMIKRTGRAGLGAIIGVGVLGLIVVAASAFRRPRRPVSPFVRYSPTGEPSFLRQALRGVALSMLGVLAGRVAQSLPLPQAQTQGRNAPAE